MNDLLRFAAQALVLALVLVMPVHAAAQTDGRLTGVVLDSTGAFVPGATVAVKNERTGEERTVKANNQGFANPVGALPNALPNNSLPELPAVYGWPGCSLFASWF